MNIAEKQLRTLVSESSYGIRDLVTFLESPADLAPLYEKARIFVAPHQYAAGIQFKLSEAMAAGVPCVASFVSAAGFGFTSGSEFPPPPFCIGSSSKDFARCIFGLNEDEARWQEYRNKGINYIENTHREFLVSSALQKALNLATHN